MTDESNHSPVTALLGLALALVLIVGGAAFYFAVVRQQQAMAIAQQNAENAQMQVEQARQMEARVRDMLARAYVQSADVRQDANDRPSAENSDDAIRTAVESVLHIQEDAWNRGDVDGFVEHYWHSPDVTFSSSGATTRGWEATVNRYRERYPTREKMGQLSFDNLEITPLSAEAALVLGQWKLDRDSEPVSGNFSLVFRKLDGRWVIVHDHTSRAENKP